MSVMTQKPASVPPQIAALSARAVRAMPIHTGLRTFADRGFVTPEPIDLERYDAFLAGTATRREDIVMLEDSRRELWGWRKDYFCAKFIGPLRAQLTRAHILGAFAEHNTRWIHARFPSRYQAATHRLSTHHFLRTWHAGNWNDAGEFALKTGAYFLFGCGLVSVAQTWLECARSAYQQANTQFGAGAGPSLGIGKTYELEGDAICTSPDSTTRMAAIERYAQARWWYRYSSNGREECERVAAKFVRLVQRECASLGTRTQALASAAGIPSTDPTDPLAESFVQIGGKMRNISFGIVALPSLRTVTSWSSLTCVAEHLISPTNMVLQCYADGGIYLSVFPPAIGAHAPRATPIPAVQLGWWESHTIGEPVLNDCIARVIHLRDRAFLWRSPVDVHPVAAPPSSTGYTCTWRNARDQLHTLHLCEQGEILYRTPRTHALLLIGLWHYGVV